MSERARGADSVRFADGFDQPERVAFGLEAAQLAAAAGCTLVAWWLLRSDAPGVLRDPALVMVAVVGAALGAGRWGGRPLTTWAWLALRYMSRPRRSKGAHALAADRDVPDATVPLLWSLTPRATTGTIPARALPRPTAAIEPVIAPRPIVRVGLPPAWEARRPPRADAHSRLASLGSPPIPTVAGPPAARMGGPSHERGEQAPARARLILLPVDHAGTAPTRHGQTVVAPLPHPAVRNEADGAVPSVAQVAPRQRLAGFLAARPGAGATTLTVEVASALVDRATVAAADLSGAGDELAERLGARRRLPTASGDALETVQAHGVAIVLTPPRPLGARPRPRVAADASRALAAVAATGAAIAVLDLGAGLGAPVETALAALDELWIAVAPTPAGVRDLYDVAAGLRRLGVCGRLRCVAMRADTEVHLHEVMDDLGADLDAAVPDDPTVALAAHRQRPLAGGGDGRGAVALHALARSVGDRLLGGVPPAPR